MIYARKTFPRNISSNVLALAGYTAITPVCGPKVQTFLYYSAVNNIVCVSYGHKMIP